MADQPAGTFPIVFESGVIAFDEDGALHVFLSHSAQAPHPLLTHPDGGEGQVAGEVRTATVAGGAKGGAVFGGFLETDDKPVGLELVISGYKLVKLEASGDLTVVVEDCTEVPSWFSPGKVHRFDGPDGPIRLWSGSAPVPKRKTTSQPKARPSPDPQPRATAKGGGCALLLALVAVGGGLLAVGALA